MPTFNCPRCGGLIESTLPGGSAVRCPLCNEVVQVAVPVVAGVAPAVHTIGYSTRTAPVSQGMAIAALVLGILGLVSCPLVGIVGLILGIVALLRANRQPTEYGGKGLAIGGIATGAASLLIVPLLFAILLPSLSRARELSKRTVCNANMRGIGAALGMYATNNNGAFPEEGADWQARLVGSGNISLRTLICPSDARVSGTSYHYVPGYGANSNPNQILLYEDGSTHQNQGGNVLYVSGIVQFVKQPALNQAISSIKMPNGRAYAPK